MSESNDNPGNDNPGNDNPGNDNPESGDPGKGDEGQESLLEFPCRFPIKAMGLDESEFEAHVLQIVSSHVDDIGPDDVSIRPSSKGKFLAITVTITATSQEHLDRVYRNLTASERILYVL
jgi:putative lipoic acid-binding regulatory protein